MIRKIRKVLTGSGAGWGDVVAIPELRRRGQIMRVMMREDPTLDQADSGIVTIWEDRHPPATATPWDRRVYASALDWWTGSATVLEIDDNLAASGGRAYDCEDKVFAAYYAKTAKGPGASTKLYLTIWALVED